MINVAKKIDELRKARAWSIYRLSMETGLTQQAIHAWYSPSKPVIPSIATLEVVCDVFGITLSDFFAENHVIELTPELKDFYENWAMLTGEERKLIDTLIKKLINNKY